MSEFDLDQWIAGTCGLIKKAKIYQRGDLLAQLDELKREIEIAKETPPDQRGVDEPSVDALMDQWEKVAGELADSALVLHVQDRTDERRRKIRDRLVKENKLNLKDEDDVDTIILHQIADSIVKIQVGDTVTDLPAGLPVNQLRAIRDRVGDSGLIDLRDTYYKVISEAPTVTAPLSRSSSSNRGGVS